MIKCIVIDDEPIAADIIVSFIHKTPELVLEKSFNDSIEAMSYLNKNKIDLLFLDINMPNLNGIELKKVLGKDIRTIFTTAYSEYAVESYELEAVDYLLKPIEYSRFVQAVQKFKKEFSSKIKQEFLVVKSGYEYHKIFYEDITYIESLSNYVKIYTAKDFIMTIQTMNDLEQKLPAGQFMRIHRSYIVSIKHIVSFDQECVKLNSITLPISKTYQKNLKNFT